MTGTFIASASVNVPPSLRQFGECLWFEELRLFTLQDVRWLRGTRWLWATDKIGSAYLCSELQV